jgi:voltage-gated potassium channel
MKSLTFTRVFVVYITSLLLVAYLFASIEGKTMFEGFYWASVTATTIGYGDLLPTQTSTRVIMIIFAHFQVFVCIPCVIALILSNIIHDSNRFTHEEQEWMEEAMEKMAAKLGVDVNKAPDGGE